MFTFPLVRSKSFDSAIFLRKIFMFVLISSFQRSTFEKSLDLSKLNRNLSAFMSTVRRRFLHRKEVIHPHVPVGIPCYDLTPIISPTLGARLLCRLPPRLRVLPTLMVWRAVCTNPGNVFTVTCWFTITSDSVFMKSSCRLQSELGPSLWVLLHLAISLLFVTAIVARV